MTARASGDGASDDCATDDCATDDCASDDCASDDCASDDCASDDRATDDDASVRRFVDVARGRCAARRRRVRRSGPRRGGDPARQCLLQPDNRRAPPRRHRPVQPASPGNFTGTTDEIIQWAACKWGFDEDVVRAQIAKESWWCQRNGGDFTTDPSRCHPDTLRCRRSARGVRRISRRQQVRYPYHGSAPSRGDVLDGLQPRLRLAAGRTCFEGYETWLNQFERGRDYAAGDLWGCIGAWFSGRWYTPPAATYIAAVQDYLDQRIWTRPEFINFTG